MNSTRLVSYLFRCTKYRLALALFYSFAVAASEQRNIKLLIAAEDSWPPFSDRRGNGISYNLAKAALATQGYDLKKIVVPYARALQLTRSGKVDACWNVTRQYNTEEDFLFGDEPLFNADISFYYSVDRPSGFDSIESVPSDTRVGVILGYEYGDAFEQHKNRFKLVALPSQASLLKMMDAGRLDVVLMFDKVFDSVVASQKFEKEKFRKGNTFYTSQIYIAFSAKSDLSIQYSAVLDRGIRELKATGVYEMIFQP